MGVHAGARTTRQPTHPHAHTHARTHTHTHTHQPPNNPQPLQHKQQTTHTTLLWSTTRTFRRVVRARRGCAQRPARSNAMRRLRPRHRAREAIAARAAAARRRSRPRHRSASASATTIVQAPQPRHGDVPTRRPAAGGLSTSTGAADVAHGLAPVAGQVRQVCAAVTGERQASRLGHLPDCGSGLGAADPVAIVWDQRRQCVHTPTAEGSGEGKHKSCSGRLVGEEIGARNTSGLWTHACAHPAYLCLAAQRSWSAAARARHPRSPENTPSCTHTTHEARHANVRNCCTRYIVQTLRPYL